MGWGKQESRHNLGSGGPGILEVFGKFKPDSRLPELEHCSAMECYFEVLGGCERERHQTKSIKKNINVHPQNASNNILPSLLASKNLLHQILLLTDKSIFLHPLVNVKLHGCSVDYYHDKGLYDNRWFSLSHKNIGVLGPVDNIFCTFNCL